MPRRRPQLQSAWLPPLLALLLLAGGCGGAAPPAVLGSAPVQSPGVPTAVTSVERQLAVEVFYLVNEQRHRAGLEPLTWDEEAAQVAWSHSADMATRWYFDHDDPDGLSPGDRLLAAGIVWTWAGENIAYGQETSSRAVEDWMASSGHRESILRAAFTHTGVGVRRGSGGTFWTQVFYRP